MNSISSNHRHNQTCLAMGDEEFSPSLYHVSSHPRGLVTSNSNHHQRNHPHHLQQSGKEEARNKTNVVHCYEDPINLKISRSNNQANSRLQSTIISINQFNERYNNSPHQRNDNGLKTPSDSWSASIHETIGRDSHQRNPVESSRNPNVNNFIKHQQQHHQRQIMTTTPVNSKSTINLSNYSNSHHDQQYSPSCSYSPPSSSASPSSYSPIPREAASRPPKRVSSLIKSAKSMSSLIHHNKTGSNSSSITLTSSSTNCSSSVDKQSSSSSGHQNTAQSSQMLDEPELLQIELNFKAHKTFVHVCRCLANLYFTKTDLINGGRVSSPRAHEWELNRTGVPIIVFDKGDTKSRPKRQLQLVLAERGSGFPLWKDVIDNLTDYKSIAPTFHTLYTSSDHRKMAGLSFDSSEAAEDFLNQIELITSDPLNIALSAPKSKSASLKSLKHQKSSGSSCHPGPNGTGSKSATNGSHKKSCFSLFSSSPKSCSASSNKSKKGPLKSEISKPCLFQHVTSVELSDFEKLFSMSSLLMAPPAPPSASSSTTRQVVTHPSPAPVTSYPPIASVSPFVVNPKQRSMAPIEPMNQLKKKNHYNHHQAVYSEVNGCNKGMMIAVNGSDGTSSLLTSSGSSSPTVMINSSPSGYGSHSYPEAEISSNISY